MTALYAVMVCLMLLIAVQFLLLMVAAEEFLGGRSGALLPAAAGSGACFAASLWLIRYVVAPRDSRCR